MKAGDRKQGINCWPCHSVEVEPSLQTFIRGIFFSIDRLMLKDGACLDVVANGFWERGVVVRILCQSV